MKRRKMTLPALLKKKQAGEPITMLTCYDATFARLLDRAGVDIMLIGDSLGMVVQGHETTLPVTFEEVLYHARAVARGTQPHTWSRTSPSWPIRSVKSKPSQMRAG